MNILIIIGTALALSLALYVAYQWQATKAELPPEAPRTLRLRELYKRLGAPYRIA